jgi:hypothetical protein
MFQTTPGACAGYYSAPPEPCLFLEEAWSIDALPLELVQQHVNTGDAARV